MWEVKGIEEGMRWCVDRRIKNSSSMDVAETHLNIGHYVYPKFLTMCYDHGVKTK
jgi:hypothetical protein